MVYSPPSPAVGKDTDISTTYELQKDFRAEVIEVSMSTPVVVDFWAEWCGPCKVLGPILEKLAAEAAGKWKLVKVDTEAWQDLAQAFQIRAIPTVVMIHEGRPVSNFQGALPEDQLRKWLHENLPGEPPSGLDLATEALAQGDTDQARKILLRTLATEPDNADAKSLLVRILFRTDLDAAVKLAGELPEENFQDLKANLSLLLDLVRWDRGEVKREITGGSETDRADYRRAASALTQGDLSGAVDLWLGVMERDRKLDEDGARRAAVALFDLLGPEDPLSRAGRRQMAAILF